MSSSSHPHKELPEITCFLPGGSFFEAYVTPDGRFLPRGIPDRFARIIAATSERDREYFEQHPGESEYTRDAIPGESWPVLSRRIARVRVVQVRPGQRLRFFLEGGAE